MRHFGVSGDGLRAAAAKVDAIADRAAESPRFTVGAGLGHTALSSSVSSFAGVLAERWAEFARMTEGVARNLRGTASIYERADGEGAAGLQVGPGGEF
ncbi:type VII secretion target [Microbacterium sp. p3-SID338]|uniref:type VII secretion target n=1 Tax=unclassified Microbacterium TaxID=2609290 RepID=UPI000C805BFB|nr:MULTISPECIES: type VII secretion target [unclassified Microbacterium]MCT1395461.1 type VII secretion target [Microbacterium sp. p3-SID338]PMC02898.1 hypothetical protein CJ226_12860 [Microbacterium sp. UMB0228]